MRAAAEAAQHGNPNAVSDARTAGALALAGILGAVENVRINASPDDPAMKALLEKAESALRDARTVTTSLGLTA